MSLRWRLVLAFSLVVFLSLLIAGIVVSVLLQGVRNRTTLNQLEKQARPVYVQFRSLLSGQTSLANAGIDLQEQSQSNNLYILLVDNNGNIVRQLTPRANQPPLSISNGTLPHDLTSQTSGTVNTNSGKFLYVAYPIARTAVTLAVTGERFNTLVLATPRSEVATIWAGIFGPFLWAGIASLIISIVLAIFIARSIYRPVQRLSSAAGEVARGKYDKTLPVEGAKELRELSASFNEMTAKVKESQEQLRQFVADTSHQLKSPLTSIQGFAQAMIDGTAGDEAMKQKATQIIADESKRMIRQVNELLELSRIQAGQLIMSIGTVDLKEVLLQCQEIFALRLQEKNIHMSSQIGGLTTTNGDADRLEDVFCNLLDNAIKNTPAHGEISVTGQNIDNAVEVIISDSGPGIPPEQLPYVFKRFQSGAGLRSGTGLGLAIAREIILAHKGTIEARSNPGEGAQFIVRLPAG